ncbi:MAG: hypothetical protein M1819_000727 [Sarea resinae]|nr:MAG: hypothetical protein M1819_000727 [Sarea resinae]
MDAFRILSRSTNFNRAGAANAKPSAQKTPSTGAAVNPQLFGHDEDLTSSTKVKNGAESKRKRKRGQDDLSAPSAQIPEELDFFGDRKHSTKKPGPVEKSNGEQNHSHTQKPPEERDLQNGDSGRLEEEDCKRILRAHKLKVTLLSSGQEEETRKASKDRKKKKHKKEAKKESASAKKSSVQLYPQPLTSFSQLRTRYRISKRLAENIVAQGYTVPTEVQLGTLPLLLASDGGFSRDSAEQAPRTNTNIDLLTVAPTGSGKTLAFLIPVLNALLRDKRSETPQGSKADGQSQTEQGVKAIVIVPTKELAGQIVNEGRKLALGTGIKVSLMRKGMRILANVEDQDHSEQEEDSNESEAEDAKNTTNGSRSKPVTKADILVTTPLNLLHAITNSATSTALPMPSVRYLILDEADVLLDPLFKDQTLGIWNACVNPSLRVSLWSATMGSNIETLAQSTIQSRHESLLAPNDAPELRSQLIRVVVGLKDAAIPNISHRLVYAATEQGKLLALRQLLHPTSPLSSSTGSKGGAQPTPAPVRLLPPFLIFTQTIPRAIALHAELLYDIPPEAGGSTRLAVLHASLSAAARDAIMARFRAGEVWVLITTDLLARGVDFRGLNGVVNYDIPTSTAAYVHRVGRTGRGGRQGGVAVTFYTKEDIPFVRGVANVIAASERSRSGGGGGADGSVDGGGNGEATVQQWLLDALPTPSKRTKKDLKRRGVEARRPAPVISTSTHAHAHAHAHTHTGTKDTHSEPTATATSTAAPAARARAQARARISTKSGFERRLENKRRGAVEAARERGRGRAGGVRARKPSGTGGAKTGHGRATDLATAMAEKGAGDQVVEWDGFDD